jgi:hypothetical protein
MPSLDEAKSVLDEAFRLEIQAMENCGEMLKEFKLNGFSEMVAHIRNNEIRHQQMVMTLIGYLR